MWEKVASAYNSQTSNFLKLLDAYLVFVMATGVIQFVYMILVGTYPYNAFLAGFIASVGSFCLTVNLRMQANADKTQFQGSQERMFAEYIVANLVLLAFAVNFLG